MSSPFDAAIQAAEAREAEEEAARERQRIEREALLERTRQERHAQELLHFGRKFLEAVVHRVVRSDWKPAYIRNVKAYSENLLLTNDPEGSLPAIEAIHQQKILDIFAYGLKLKADHDVDVPDGFFYGQRLLAAQEIPAESIATSALDNVIPLKVTGSKSKGRNRQSA